MNKQKSCASISSLHSHASLETLRQLKKERLWGSWMKKSIILILLSWLWVAHVKAQELITIGPCSVANDKVYYINGVRFIFISKSSQSHNLNSSVSFCNNYLKQYYFEGIELSEENFFNLNLKQKDIDGNNAWYTYRYNNQDTANCVECVVFNINVSVHIRLNGFELKANEKGAALKQIHSGQIVDIKSSRNIFGKATIEINTQ